MRTSLLCSFVVLALLSGLHAAPDTTPDSSIVGMTSPTGLAFGSNGRVFVAEYRNGNSLKTWPSSAAWSAGSAPDASVAAVSAESVAVNSNGSVIAVSITEDGSFVRFYRLQGGALVFDFEFGGNNAANQGDPGGTSTVNSTSLAFPRGLRFDTAGNLWIADDAFNRIVRIPAARLAVGAPNAYTPDIVLGAATFTTRGASLAGVKDIAFDAAGNLFAVSYNSNEIVRYNGPFQANRVDPDARYALTASPVNLAFSGATLYVTMPGQRSVWSFNSITSRAGGAISADAVFGASSGALQFGGGFGPQGVAFDTAGNLHVCDLDNNRVVRFDNTLPAPTLKVKGSTKISTTKSKLTIRGTAVNATKVEYQLGKSAFRAAKGNSSAWSVALKLLPGKNTVNVRAEGPGGKSRVLKLVITRS